MFAVSDIAPGSQQSSATQLQMQLIASTALTQRVSAMETSQNSGDAGAQGSGARQDAAKLIRQTMQKNLAKTDGKIQPASVEKKSTPEAVTKSVIEAQEASETDNKLTAAFQARYALTDLLSVIRDPEDKMLPNAPSDSDS